MVYERHQGINRLPVHYYFICFDFDIILVSNKRFFPLMNCHYYNNIMITVSLWHPELQTVFCRRENCVGTRCLEPPRNPVDRDMTASPRGPPSHSAGKWTCFLCLAKGHRALPVLITPDLSQRLRTVSSSSSERRT